ncbi:MAG: hypothetical protein P4L31_03680 [Candidatus Babeliales bacterium]|nr:hypothetical protein [Candidatus Babeliales bacterium]
MKRNMHILMICACSFVGTLESSSDKYKVSVDKYRTFDDKYRISKNTDFSSIQPIAPVQGATAEPSQVTRRSSMLTLPPIRPTILENNSSTASSTRSSMASSNASCSPILTPYASQDSTPTRSRSLTQPNMNAQQGASSSESIPGDMSLMTSRRKAIVHTLINTEDSHSAKRPGLKYSNPNVVEVGATGANGILRLLDGAENLYKTIFEKQDMLQKKIANAKNREASEERKSYIKSLEQQLDALQGEYCQEFLNRERLYARYWRARFEEQKYGPVSHR